ncbi:MAG TPA: glycosyltransferase family 4 protein [Thermoleophilaceae bacterium]|nr:glycosyltransferase family 4 protein [Thermoleophilaceae bacterium]
MNRTVAMGLLFYPRGGSAQVTLYLALALRDAGWTVELLSGSLGHTGDRTHAPTFFGGVASHPVDYGPAVADYEQGLDPMASPVPLHPSYEDRPGVPDRNFAAVSPELAAHSAEAWTGLIRREMPPFDVAHLHHLTPMADAMRAAAPEAPVVTHLHGTELKMLDRALRLTGIAALLGTSFGEMADRGAAGLPAQLDGVEGDDLALALATRWAQWRHTAFWIDCMRGWAAASDRLVVVGPHDQEEAGRLLEVDASRTTWIPNGVDLERFVPLELSPDQRLQRWRRWLVEDPQAWVEGGVPGSLGYDDADLGVFTDRDSGAPAPVLMFVGRFTEVKRIPLLIRAYARAREHFDRAAPLVIWGGFPGEWEGEHPHTVAMDEGVDDVFFVGWRGHDELPEGLACADVMVMPSTNESFGQVFIEAMACRVPVIAAEAGGTFAFVNVDPHDPNGWLVAPDDLDSLADAMVDAVNHPADRAARGASGLDLARAEYSWTTLAERTAGVYDEVVAGAATAV